MSVLVIRSVFIHNGITFLTTSGTKRDITILDTLGLFSTGDTSWTNRFLYLWTLLRWGLGVPLALLGIFSIFYVLSTSVLSIKQSSVVNLLTNEWVRNGLLIACFCHTLSSFYSDHSRFHLHASPTDTLSRSHSSCSCVLSFHKQVGRV